MMMKMNKWTSGFPSQHFPHKRVVQVLKCLLEVLQLRVRNVSAKFFGIFNDNWSFIRFKMP